MATYDRIQYSVDKDGNVVEKVKRWDDSTWGKVWEINGVTGSKANPEAFFQSLKEKKELIDLRQYKKVMK